MKEIQKIIVPIDFHKHTDQIIDYAGYIAKKFDAKLHVIHVVESPPTYVGYDYATLGSFEEEVMEHSKKMMQKIIEKNQNTLAGCEEKIIKGDIVNSIIQYTKDVNGDLIIIGTHGRKGLSKMWLGSVAERVIKRAPCPAITCNPYKPAS